MQAIRGDGCSMRLAVGLETEQLASGFRPGAVFIKVLIQGVVIMIIR